VVGVYQGRESEGVIARVAPSKARAEMGAVSSVQVRAEVRVGRRLHVPHRTRLGLGIPGPQASWVGSEGEAWSAPAAGS
jgi:hypothetical protein